MLFGPESSSTRAETFLDLSPPRAEIKHVYFLNHQVPDKDFFKKVLN